MNIKSYLRKSISRQFVALICFFILLFLIGGILLVFEQERINNQYVETRSTLVEKTTIVRDLNNHLDKAMFDARGYFAFKNSDMKQSSIEEGIEAQKLIDQFNVVAVTEDDYLLVSELKSFHDYYFNGILPEAFRYFENGDTEAVANIAADGGTERSNGIKTDLNNYILSTNDLLNKEVDHLKKQIAILQVGFLVYIVLVIFIVFFIGRTMVNRIGKPLSDFALAAYEIAKGNHAVIHVDKSREDELSTLSVAFKHMIQSIQEKEQDLTAHNEELLAQQDELQAQQLELERVLETVQLNEESLKRRNSLINGISSSLFKTDVLESIIRNLSAVLRADRGIIVMLEDSAYASYGIAPEGAEQFKDYLFTGMFDRLKKDKAPFILTRELSVQEKGYHLEKGYVHDLYIPVLNAKDDIIAVIMLSRFSDAFTTFDKEEFISLAKQIGISLEKIYLFEQTEKDRVLNRDILNTVQEGIQLVSDSGEIILVNKKFSSLVGDPKETVFYVGCSWDEWMKYLQMQFVETEELLDFMEASIKEKQQQSCVAFTKDGKVINIYMEELHRGTDKFGSVFVYRDITKEYEVDRMKSEFVSTVSHELRTPLASILGFTELMINRDLKVEKQKKYLNTIYGEAKRLTSLINDFLDVQRMEAGKQAYEKKYIELLPIVERVKDHLQINATSTHTISVINKLAESVILGDKAKVEQVITNILSNAIKYSPDGGKIEIKLYEDSQQIKLAISDEGLGIPESAMDKLFTKFYRVDNSDRRKIGGTGLGLAIVQEIMNAHDGKVIVESEYGKGSTFILVFPAAKVVSANIMENDQQMEQRQHYKVLVVEDDVSLGELIVHELQDNGFQVTYFQNGQEAIKYLAENPPDAVVLDIMLQDDQLDGWEIMKKLKESEQLKYIPVIVSTALDEKEKGISLGAMDYLVKPYPPSELSKSIIQTLLKMGKVGQVLIPKDN
ncbi:ATP-binding protein [Bacillus sp. B1-b2]|uniref:ATP-binding protein n=1 Tax=Bacillus sp. B1-b2 TaxID=2653201 RepID=UPI0012625A96|nr:ATP-binding protein [Bacillus sp. B1-b2]KAB7666897.1 response regulator [Bacillus sp. B1-b2]